MACRYVFLRGFRDDVYLEALQYCSIAHTAMYEVIRFSALIGMVLNSDISLLALHVLQNLIIVLVDHMEVIWKIKQKLGVKVELYHLWMNRIEGSCINVFGYVIPIFASITAFGIVQLSISGMTP